jgi:hypothetical protein
MDEELEAAREAERKAAALHYLGWEVGVGAAIWARAAQDLLALHESARARYAANTANREVWERFHGTAYMLVVAVDQILGFERRVRRLTGDAELAKARARFDLVCPDAEDLRDMVAHLDEYAVGSGWRQRPTAEGMPAPLSEKNVSPLPFWTDEGSTYLDLGDKRLNLGDAAAAATELAHVVEEVRAKHRARAGQEANDARRRWFERYMPDASTD